MGLKYEMQNGREVCSITGQHSYKPENTRHLVTLSARGPPGHSSGLFEDQKS